MDGTRYRFECRDVADCDVVITAQLRASVVEAARSHLRDVHGREVTEAELDAYVQEV